MTSAFFHRNSANFAKSRNTFPESLKIFLINMVTNLMMSAKMATPDLLKIKLLLNKGCDMIISVHHVTNKTLSSD